MSNRIPFTYGEFYDYPRMVYFEFAGKWYYLNSPFDDVRDDYPDFYKVYLLPFGSEEELKLCPLFWMHQGNLSYLGQIPIVQLGLDESRRKSIETRAFEKWLQNRSQ